MSRIDKGSTARRWLGVLALVVALVAGAGIGFGIARTMGGVAGAAGAPSTAATSGQSAQPLSSATTTAATSAPVDVSVDVFGNLTWRDLQADIEQRDQEYIDNWGIIPMTPATASLPTGRGGAPSLEMAGVDTDYFRAYCHTQDLQALNKEHPDLWNLCASDITGENGWWWSSALIRACADGSVAACHRQTVRAYEGFYVDGVRNLDEQKAVDCYPEVDPQIVRTCVADRDMNACTQVISNIGQLDRDMFNPPDPGEKAYRARCQPSYDQQSGH